MAQERGPEKFQPRMVASFSRVQIESVEMWLKNALSDSRALDHDLTVA